MNRRREYETNEINETNEKCPGFRYAIFWLFLLSSIFAMSCKATNKSAAKAAVIETDLGQIKIKFDSGVAPKHVEHFSKLAREGFYDGLAFHRVVPGMLIQGGDPQTRNDDPSLWGRGVPGQETVPAEFSSKPFVRGTVGAARKRMDVNSATSQFFICLRENPAWNGQYTVLGEVVEGIDVVDRISRAPSDPRTQNVLEKVVIKRVLLEN